MALDVRRAETQGVDISERGRDADGKGITLNRRLYMQLLAFGDCYNVQSVIDALEQSAVTATVYLDANDPYGIAVLFASEEPNAFVTDVRRVLQSKPFTLLTPKPELTMFGRTYSIGYEQDLEHTLINRPLERVTNLDLAWAIWYPLRREGAFEQLSADEQRTILMEHGGIGMAYGRAGLGTDIRLACHGLDQNDNDFVIALIGKELTPLSKIVERMRKTKQTSQYLASLGPFFVGKIIWTNKQ